MNNNDACSSVAHQPVSLLHMPTCSAWTFVTSHQPTAHLHFVLHSLQRTGCLQIVIEVVDRKARPEIPDRSKLPGEALCLHTQYVDLMQECWAQDPFSRPSFEQIIGRLRSARLLLCSLPWLPYCTLHPRHVLCVMLLALHTEMPTAARLLPCSL